MVEEGEKRTGTQLLISLEQKVDLLTKYVRNLDNTVKIMLKRMNEEFAKGHVAPQSVQQQPSAPPPPAKPKLQRPGEKVKFSDLPKTNKFELAKLKAGILDDSDDPPKPDDDIEEEFVHKGKQRGRRVAASSDGTKVTVSQQIYTDDGNPLGFAGVEIMDANGIFVKNGRTNQNGRWSLPLVPGDYTIHVVKRYSPDSGMIPVEATYEAVVTASEKPLQLEDKIIE